MVDYLLYVNNEVYGSTCKDEYPEVGDQLKTRDGVVVVQKIVGGKVYAIKEEYET